MEILKNTALFLIAVLLAHYTAVYFGSLYGDFVSIPSHLTSGWIGTEASNAYFNGIGSAYIFFLTSLFVIFGVGKKHWWLGTLLLPAAAFVIYFDLPRFWFYILIALAGWVVGLGIVKVLYLIKMRKG